MAELKAEGCGTGGNPAFIFFLIFILLVFGVGCWCVGTGVI